MNAIQRILHKAIGGFGKSPLQWTINGAGEWIYNSGSHAYIDGGYKALPNLHAVISLILSKSTVVPHEIYTVKNKKKHQKYKAMMASARTMKDYSRTLKVKEEALEKVENSEIEKLLETPNTYQSWEQLLWEIDGYKLLTGNSLMYMLSLTDGGKPIELHNIPSPLVEMIVKGNMLDPKFEYKISYMNSVIQGDDVVHFKYWNPISGTQTGGNQYWGLSPLQSCEKLLGRYNDADITQGFQFKNMGPGGMITGNSSNPESNLTEEQAISVQDRFNQQHTGTYRAGSIMVTPSNLKWTAFGLSAVDLNIDEAKEQIANEISNVYHVPIAFLSGKNSTENNMIESRKALITDAVIPLVESRKQMLQKHLLSRFGDNYVIEYDYTVFHEMQDDIKKLAEVYNSMDWISDNEKRAGTGYDRDPRPEADFVYKNQSQVPRQDLGMGGVEMIDEEML